MYKNNQDSRYSVFIVKHWSLGGWVGDSCDYSDSLSPNTAPTFLTFVEKELATSDSGFLIFSTYSLTLILFTFRVRISSLIILGTEEYLQEILI